MVGIPSENPQIGSRNEFPSKVEFLGTHKRLNQARARKPVVQRINPGRGFCRTGLPIQKIQILLTNKTVYWRCTQCEIRGDALLRVRRQGAGTSAAARAGPTRKDGTGGSRRC